MNWEIGQVTTNALKVICQLAAHSMQSVSNHENIKENELNTEISPNRTKDFPLMPDCIGV